MNPIRLGLIGAGRWGQRIIATLNEILEAKLDFLVTGKEENSKLSSHSPKVLSRWEDLLEKPIDGVLIASPAETHGEILKNFIRRGIPVFVEKPMTTSLKESLEIQKIVKETGTKILVDHTLLFHPGYQKLKEKIGTGMIRAIISESVSYGPFRKETPVLWDWTPHDLYLAIDLLGEEPLRISSVGMGLETLSDSADFTRGMLSIRLDFLKGEKVWIHEGNLISTKRRSFMVHGSEESYEWVDHATSSFLKRYARGILIRKDAESPSLGEGEVIPYAEGRPLSNALREFVKGVKEDRESSYFGVDLAVKVARAIERVAESMTGNGRCG